MSIYTPRINYRKIYEQHYGPYPADYEIHHIDGDYTNNNPANLQAVTIQEHFDIHYAQKDWAACAAIAMRLSVDSKERSKIISEHQRIIQGNRVKNGTHNFLGGEVQRVTASKLLAEGTHNFLANHPSKTKVTCPHCGKTGDKPNMSKYHFNKCKSLVT